MMSKEEFKAEAYEALNLHLHLVPKYWYMTNRGYGLLLWPIVAMAFC